MYRGAFAHARSCSGDTHPRRAGARQFGHNWLRWHVGGDQLAPSRPALCTPCPVSVSTGWLVGWPAFPAPWGTQPSCLATEHRGSSGPTAGDTRGPRLQKCRVRRLLWDASVAVLVSQYNANYAGDDSTLQPRPAGSMVNMERQDAVNGIVVYHLPTPTPLLAFSFCVNMIRFIICGASPPKNLWVIVIGQILWSLFTTPAGYRVRRRRKVELVASDRRITHTNTMRWSGEMAQLIECLRHTSMKT